ncbi:MAG TPA: FAD:protein FMN transferase [Pirellulaceae bacterium]|nr:FAD:protein FMN transferase [Pirellulaceae bacterium]
MNTAAALLLTAAASLAQAETPALERFSQRQLHMGVEFEVVLYAPDRTAADKGLAAAFERIAELDRILSDYDAESELSRLSASSPSKEPVSLSADLWTVLAHAQDVSEQSGGAFDVTAGPLTKLWRRARRQKEPPTEEQIARALAAVGYKQLELDAERHTARLLKPEMRLDLGGIAKGYAADEALATMGKLGIERALVRASGDIAVSQPPPNEKGWKVGIAPLDPDQTPTQFVLLASQAISTSGDSRQHLVVSGKRYSHIIDPRTGWGIEGRRSVTVIARRGMEADSLATAISILDPASGMRLIEATPNASALIVVEQDGSEQPYRSQRFSHDGSN